MNAAPSAAPSGVPRLSRWKLLAKWARRLGSWWALGVALAACALVVGASGHDPVEAARALAWGALGSPVRAAETLAKSIPLAMAGLGVALCFRAGFWNIGAEGQLAVGALAATATATRVLPWWPLALTAGGAAGAAWALAAWWLRQKRGAPEIISTIMLNAIAAQGVVFAVSGPLQERAREQPQSDLFAPGARLPLILPDTTLHWGLLAPVAAAVGLWWLLGQTRAGFEWQAAGANPRAARAGGIDASRATFGAVALGGGLCGLGGALEVCGATHQLGGEPLGYGFAAIAVALVAGLRPLQVLPSALFFGALDAGGKAMERTAGVPAVTVSIVTGAALLAVAVARRAQR